MNKIALFSTAFLILCIMVFSGCATSPEPSGPNIAPEFEYTIDDSKAPDSVKPFMTLFEGIWKWGSFPPGSTVYYKFVLVKVDGENAEVKFSHSAFTNSSGIKFNAKKMQLTWGIGIPQFMDLINDNGKLIIKGTRVRGRYRDRITMKPATRE